MDLRAISRAVCRQFPVVFIIGVITVMVALSAAKDTETRYEGRASLLFVSSPAGYDLQGKPITLNPLNLSGNGERVASSVVLAMSKSPAFEEQLLASGASGTVKFRRTADAILDVKATADTPAAALGTLNTAVTLVSNQLAASQASAGAPLGTYLKINTLASTDHAREIVGSPIKSVGAIAVVGIVLAIAAAMALDAVAPHGIRSGVRLGTRGVRGVTRGVGRLGRALKLPPPVPRSPAERRNGPAAPSVPQPASNPTSASAPAPASPAPVPSAHAASAPSPSSVPTSAPSKPAPSAPTPSAPAPAPAASASTPGPTGGNRQMRRQAARAATRARERAPAPRSSHEGDGAPRAPRSG